MNEFVADLRRLAKDCNFGDKLETMLRNRLACGINDQAIQRKMLTEKKLTFKLALEIAESTCTSSCRKLPRNERRESERGTGEQGERKD